MGVDTAPWPSLRHFASGVSSGGGGDVSDESENEDMMSEAHMRLLQSRRTQLVARMTPEEIVSILQEKRLITKYEMETINRKATRQAKAEELLDVLERRSDRAFTEFRVALKSTYQTHLAKLLKPQAPPPRPPPPKEPPVTPDGHSRASSASSLHLSRDSSGKKRSRQEGEVRFRASLEEVSSEEEESLAGPRHSSTPRETPLGARAGSKRRVLGEGASPAKRQRQLEVMEDSLLEVAAETIARLKRKSSTKKISKATKALRNLHRTVLDFRTLFDHDRNVTSLEKGSLIFTLHCPTWAALHDLGDLWSRGDLAKLLDSSLLTPEACLRHGLRPGSVRFDVQLFQDDFRECERELEVSRRDAASSCEEEEREEGMETGSSDSATVDTVEMATVVHVETRVEIPATECSEAESTDLCETPRKRPRPSNQADTTTATGSAGSSGYRDGSFDSSGSLDPAQRRLTSVESFDSAHASLSEGSWGSLNRGMMQSESSSGSSSESASSSGPSPPDVPPTLSPRKRKARPDPLTLPSTTVASLQALSLRSPAATTPHKRLYFPPPSPSRSPLSPLSPNPRPPAFVFEPDELQKLGVLPRRSVSAPTSPMKAARRLFFGDENDPSPPQPASAPVRLQRSPVAGVNVGSSDEGGNTPVHLAASAGCVQVLDTLHELKLALDAPNKEGDTPLHLAAAAGHGGFTRRLLELGATPGRRDGRGRTPLHRAAVSGQARVVQHLLAAGESRLATDLHGKSPLDYCTSRDLRGLLDPVTSAGASSVTRPRVLPSAGPAPVHRRSKSADSRHFRRSFLSRL